MEATQKLYCQYRASGNHDGLLALCTEDIVVHSERDGTHVGKAAVRAYLEKIKPQGVWSEKVHRLSDTRLGMQGVVHVLFIPIQVVTTMDFDTESGRIRRVEVGRGSLPSSL